MQIFRTICEIVVLISLLYVSCFGFRYDGFATVDITPRTTKDISALWKFAGKFKDDGIGFQFTRPPSKQNIVTTAIVSPKTRQKLEQYLKQKSILYTIVIPDYQKLIDREHSENQKAMYRRLWRSQLTSDHEVYLRYEQIEDWINVKVKKCQFAQFSKFGETNENRKLFMVKISKNVSLPTVWIDGGIHAREWISTSSVLFVIDMLLQNTTLATEALSRFQFVLVPLVNPDGYEYSHSTYRLWRKNKAQFEFTHCFGVDLNRNFPYEWGGKKSSGNPCHDTYRGPNRASEREIQSVIIEMTKIKASLQLVVSVHAFGQFILQPFNYSPDDFPHNYLLMTSVAMRAAHDINRKYGTVYQVGRASDILYCASGSSDDFVVGTLNVPYSFTIELPDRGAFGFCLPPSHIRIVGQEFWDIISTLTREISILS